MSEPMTTVEIEDVLASIRRLVSEDLRAAATRSAESARAAAPLSGRLILTPALRVAPESAPVDAPAGAEAALVHPATDSAGGPTLGSVVARVGAQVGEDVDRDEWEADAPYQEADWDTPDWEDELPERTGESSVVPFVLMQERRLQSAWRDGAWADPAEKGGAPVVPLSDERAARSEEAPSVADDIPLSVPEPEARAEDLVADLRDVTIEPVPAEILAEEEYAYIPPPLYDEEEVVEETLPPEDMAEVTETIVADTAGRELDADLAEAVVMAGMAEAEEDVMARVVKEAPRVFAPGDADDFDEEALREVVRDIMREELQGALGERITRSVRKLVRAEIQRMLIARDLS